MRYFFYCNECNLTEPFIINLYAMIIRLLAFLTGSGRNLHTPGGTWLPLLEMLTYLSSIECTHPGKGTDSYSEVGAASEWIILPQNTGWTRNDGQQRSKVSFFIFPKFGSGRSEGFNKNICSQMCENVPRYWTQKPWKQSQVSYAETQHNPHFFAAGHNPTDNPSLHSQFIWTYDKSLQKLIFIFIKVRIVKPSLTLDENVIPMDVGLRLRMELWGLKILILAESVCCRSFICTDKMKMC
jgi:hypothetical protein